MDLTPQSLKGKHIVLGRTVSGGWRGMRSMASFLKSGFRPFPLLYSVKRKTAEVGELLVKKLQNEFLPAPEVRTSEIKQVYRVRRAILVSCINSAFRSFFASCYPGVKFTSQLEFSVGIPGESLLTIVFTL